MIHDVEGPPEDPNKTYLWLGHIDEGYAAPAGGPMQLARASTRAKHGA